MAQQMMLGYAAHPGDFPHVAPMPLMFALGGYKAAREAQQEAQAALRLATERKNASLDSLRQIMKDCLKRSAVDAAGDSEKLNYIGWGPVAAPQPAPPPEAAGDLTSLAEGPGTLTLTWTSGAGGGPVRNYILERRGHTESGQFGPWLIVGSFLDTRAELTNQPRGIQLEYRVKAVNTGGESGPSNPVAVVL
jgi:hypothetical protein